MMSRGTDLAVIMECLGKALGSTQNLDMFFKKILQLPAHTQMFTVRNDQKSGGRPQMASRHTCRKRDTHGTLPAIADPVHKR